MSDFTAMALRTTCFIVTVCASLVSCSSQGDSVLQKPVPACVDYQQAFAKCFHRDVAEANQPSLIPKTRAEFERISNLCTENMGRIQATCR
jgi:hypothetical protein